jgi:ubiquinol-cytochrome c reductase iron-sulfur subunit
VTRPPGRGDGDHGDSRDASDPEEVREPSPAPAGSTDAGTARRAQRTALVAVGLSFLASVGLMVLYVLGGQTQLEGILLATALGGLALAFIVWGKRLLPLPPGGVTQERSFHPSSAEDRAGLAETLDAGEAVIGRRRLLLRMALGAGAALGVALLFPFRSLGPSPGNSLFVTPWRKGLLVVTEAGERISRTGLTVDSFVTVFPEGYVGDGQAQAVLIRVQPDQLALPDGGNAGAPDGFVAYSKICTHLGCPVGLYLAATHELRCPCHQSTFDVLDGAKPVYGPAARPLPQLPLEFDDDGFLRATGDFDGPVGPSFWQIHEGPSS